MRRSIVGVPVPGGDVSPGKRQGQFQRAREAKAVQRKSRAHAADAVQMPGRNDEVETETLQMIVDTIGAPQASTTALLEKGIEGFPGADRVRRRTPGPG